MSLVNKVPTCDEEVKESDINRLYGYDIMINITFPAVVSPFNRGGVL